MDRFVKASKIYTDCIISSKASHPLQPDHLPLTSIPFIPAKWEQEQRILMLLLRFMFSLRHYIARLVPCPDSEIAARYHPSDLLRTVAQAVGTVLEKSTKSVGEKQGR